MWLINRCLILKYTRRLSENLEKKLAKFSDGKPFPYIGNTAPWGWVEDSTGGSPG